MLSCTGLDPPLMRFPSIIENVILYVYVRRIIYDISRAFTSHLRNVYEKAHANRLVDVVPDLKTKFKNPSRDTTTLPATTNDFTTS